MAIEAHLDRGRGAVATVLVQRGTLHVGDSIVAGNAYGRVRAMLGDHGEKVAEATPSRPVQVLGFTSVPGAGDSFMVVEEDRVARQIAERRQARARKAQIGNRRRISLEDLGAALAEKKIEQLTLIIKGDNSGTVEALEDSLLKLDVGAEVDLRVVHRGVGGITQDDINLAAITDAIVIGFNVKPVRGVQELADREGVDIRYYTVIYQAIDEVESGAQGPAQARVRRGADRLGRGAGDLPVLQVRQHRRLHRASAARSAATPRPGCCAVGWSSTTTCRSIRCAGSRTTRPRSARASSAVSGSARGTTSRSRTPSRPTRCGRSRARSDRQWVRGVARRRAACLPGRSCPAVLPGKIALHPAVGPLMREASGSIPGGGGGGTSDSGGVTCVGILECDVLLGDVDSLKHKRADHLAGAGEAAAAGGRGDARPVIRTGTGGR